MTSLALDTNHDLDIQNNDLVLLSGADEVKQVIIQRLKLFYGEWFLDTSKGVPYIEEVFVKNPNPTRVEAIFKEVILTTPGLIRLEEFELDFDNLTRKLTLKFLALSDNGEIRVNEVL